MHPALSATDLTALDRRLRQCRLCNVAAARIGGEAGAREAVHSRPIADVRSSHRALIVGQAPGIHEPSIGRPFGHDAGRRLRRWLAPIGLEDEERFRATFALTAVAKCYPGRDPGARGDRRPTPGQLARCTPWTAAQLALLDPPLVVPVGGMAIASLLGAARLIDVVGQRFEKDGRVLVPLPHPSGASAWANGPANRERIAAAVALIGAELGV